MITGAAKKIIADHFGHEVRVASPQMDPIIREYVCSLLVDFMDADELSRGIVLARLYQRALETDPASRFDAFRRLGDTSVFVCGFFRGYVESGLMGPQYYIDMGRLGYCQASNLTRSGQLSTLFSSLSDHVSHMVETVCAVSHRASVCKSNQP